MRKQSNFLPIAIVCLVVAMALYFFPNSFVATGVNTVVGSIAKPIGGLFAPKGQPSEFTKLREENSALFARLVKFKNQEAENKALLDQFQTVYPKSQSLLPAKIIGVPSFVPGVTSPEVFIIDKGSSDLVQKGQAVIFKEYLIGIVDSVGTYGAKVLLITNQEVSLRVKTTQGALGLLKGRGAGQMSVENVLLSENLTPDDGVYTFGEMDEQGNGLPPDLLIGYIVSVDKKPSNVFQSAEVKSTIQMQDLSVVFIVVGNK